MTGQNRAGFDRRMVEGKEERTGRKKRLTEIQATDGRPNGLVEIPGPMSNKTRDDIIHLAKNIEKREMDRRDDATILAVSPFQGGVAIETEGEKVAQMIADAIGRSRKAKVERVFDDEGKRRILTCILPESSEEP